MQRDWAIFSVIFLALLISVSAIPNHIPGRVQYEGAIIDNYIINPGFEDDWTTFGALYQASWEINRNWELLANGTTANVITDNCHGGSQCVHLTTGPQPNEFTWPMSHVTQLVEVVQTEVSAPVEIGVWFRSLDAGSNQYTAYVASYDVYEAKGTISTNGVQIPLDRAQTEWTYASQIHYPTDLIDQVEIYISIYGPLGSFVLDDAVVRPVYGSPHADKSKFKGMKKTYPSQKYTTTGLTYSLVDIEVKDEYGQVLFGIDTVDFTAIATPRSNPSASETLNVRLHPTKAGFYQVELAVSSPGVYDLEVVNLNDAQGTKGKVGKKTYEIDFYLDPGTDVATEGDFINTNENQDAYGKITNSLAYDYDTNTGYSASPSLYLNANSANKMHGAFQLITLNQGGPMPLELGVWSKSISVVNPQGEHSVAAVVNFVDGTSETVAAAFDISSTSWQQRTLSLEFDRAISTIRVELRYFDIQGEAWFDDLSVVVQQAHMDAALSRCSGSGIWSAVEGVQAFFDVIAVDSMNNAIRGRLNKADKVTVDITYTTIGGSTVSIPADKVKARDVESVFEVSYTPLTYGTHVINVKNKAGEHIGMSPFNVFVNPTVSDGSELLLNPTFEELSDPSTVSDWTSVGSSGYEVLTEPSTCRSVPCVQVISNNDINGVSQTIMIPEWAKYYSLRFAAWSRAVSVSNATSTSIGYSISMDVYYSDGTMQNDIHTPFSALDTNWQVREVSTNILVNNPGITRVDVRARFTGEGQVQFDDMSLHGQAPKISFALSKFFKAPATLIVNAEHAIDIQAIDTANYPLEASGDMFNSISTSVVVVKACDGTTEIVPHTMQPAGDGTHFAVKFVPTIVGDYAIKVMSAADENQMVGGGALVIPATRSSTLGMRVAVFSPYFEDVPLTRLTVSKDYGLDLIRETLTAMEIPHDMFCVRNMTRDNTPLELINPDGTGKYYAIMFSGQDLLYESENGFVTALTPEMQAQIEAYERDYKVRRVVISSSPLQQPGVSSTGTPTNGPIDIFPTADFLTHATHLRTDAKMEIKYSFYRPGQIDDTVNVKPFALDADGHVAAIETTLPDGRQQAHAFWTNAIYMEASVAMLPGFILWATRGIHIGRRFIQFSLQIDDHLLQTEEWDPNLKTDLGTAAFRNTVEDLDFHIQWQNWLKTDYLPEGSDVKLELAINGLGYIYDDVLADTSDRYLTPGTKDRMDHFYVESHTYTHFSLDAPRSYEDCLHDLELNRDMLEEMVCPGNPDHCSMNSMVPPMITGLFNGNALRALESVGINGVVGDNTRPELKPVNEFHGLVSTEETNGYDGIFIVPRHSTNVFFNCINDTQNYALIEHAMTPAAFNFDSFEGKDMLDVFIREASYVATYLSGYQHDPYMFHQANLIVFDYFNYRDGTTTKQSLVTLWAKAVLGVLQRWNAMPVVTLKHDDIVILYQKRMERDACQVEGKLVIEDGEVTDVLLTSENACKHVVSGVVPKPVAAGESVRYTTAQYGPDHQVWVPMASNGAVSIPLATSKTWGAVPLPVDPNEGVNVQGTTAQSDSQASSTSSSDEPSLEIFGDGALNHCVTISATVLVTIGMYVTSRTGAGVAVKIRRKQRSSDVTPEADETEYAPAASRGSTLDLLKDLPSRSALSS